MLWLLQFVIVIGCKAKTGKNKVTVNLKLVINMIALIKGEIFEINDDNLIVLAGGIGYRVYTPVKSYNSLPNIGDEIVLYTHYHLREDAALLYGFISKKELALFKLLIGVNGVGTKSALIMMNTLSYDNLLQSMQMGSTADLIKVPGIGKKIAERIILELKDKIVKSGFVRSLPENKSVSDIDFGFNDKSTAVTALVQLGYNASQATKFVESALADFSEKATIEQLITAALKVAAQR